MNNDLSLRENLGTFKSVERIGNDTLKVSFEMTSLPDWQVFLIDHTLASFLCLKKRYWIQYRGDVIVGIRGD